MAAASGREPALHFVVQEHRARTRHWDFRLEMNGVLRSWAVPKGPPAAPGIRRLAVATADHPPAYLNFEGVIPPGQYGAGTVRIWDRGTYRLVKATGDEIKVDLFGTRLRGRYVLIRLHDHPGRWIWMQVAPAAPPVPADPAGRS
ncbi:MAG: ATP-dependent DNA ligase [Firmicutes bacterium]|nr:ATP-dependent DNA ligase [Bacillota bacterium]